MRYHFFLQYGWFFQNLGKEAVRTFMHTTVFYEFSLTYLYKKRGQIFFSINKLLRNVKIMRKIALKFCGGLLKKPHQMKLGDFFKFLWPSLNLCNIIKTFEGEDFAFITAKT